MTEPHRQDPYLHIEMGACCACGKTDATVRNLVMLPEKAPMPGTGWGCFVCGLEADGAMAVICDACLDSQAEVRFVISGYATDCLRIEREQLHGLHEHDPEKHEAEDRQRARRIYEGYQAAKHIGNNGHKDGRDRPWRQSRRKSRANHNH